MASNIADNQNKAQRVAETLKAMAHPTRLRILAILCKEKVSVTGISQRLCLHQAIVSQQLRILRMSKLVNFNRDGSYAMYESAQPCLSDIIKSVERVHDPR